MNIEKISDKSLNFKGKFIFAENLTKKEIELVNKVNNIFFDKKTNTQILRRKSYDIYVKHNKNNSDLLELNTYYKNIWTGEKQDCFISFINKSNICHKGDIFQFRGSLNWFEDYKKSNHGYNNWFEKAIAYAKEYLNIY